MMLGVTILGSTGSVGLSTLDVIARQEQRFRVVALTAQRNVERLYQQCIRYQPLYAVMTEPEAALQLEQQLRAAGSSTQVLAGSAAVAQVAALAETDYVMAAIVGAAGLPAALAAAHAGKRILLANKEALVVSGALFMQALQQSGATLLPIDSEHNALFQCLPADYAARGGLDGCGVTRLLLTGSGGPFRQTPLSELEQVTPEMACKHPTWSMGRKISVDSATMMNKGLELIEAHWLFNAPSSRIEVVIHPQSVIHSMVEYIDGSVLAQLGHPDMRTPIAHALAWPERMPAGLGALDLFRIGRLDFLPPDLLRFPCLRLAREALEAGGTAAVVLNAANEIAVAAFLQQQIAFTSIAHLISEALERLPSHAVESLEQVLALDEETRCLTQQQLKHWER